MPNFPGRLDALGHTAFYAATEAVIGLLAQGKRLDEEAVNRWLKIALDGNLNLVAPAMHYAQRMLTGPHHSDWPDKPLPRR